jgi:hypothetical protein
MLEVAIAYFVSTIAVGCVLLVTAFGASLLRGRIGIRGQVVLTLLGTLLIGIAGLEKMGWAARPWSAGSPAQHFDDIMFRLVWLTGIGLNFLALMVWLASRREPSRCSETETSRIKPERHELVHGLQ